MEKKIKETLDLIEKESIKHAQASEQGDHKVGNRIYVKLTKAMKLLRDNNSLSELKELLHHQEASVRMKAATYLLETCEEEAIEILENISKENIPHLSFTAQIILDEWRNGELELYFGDEEK